MASIRIMPSQARPIYYATLAGAVLCTILGFLLLSANMLATSALLFGGAGTISSSVRAYYINTSEMFGDSDRFPSGPPSHVVREMSSFEGESGTLRHHVAQTALNDMAPTIFYALTFLIGIPAIWL